MDSSLRVFIRQIVGTVAAALVPVVLAAFWSIPYSFGGHPGETRDTEMATRGHMT